MLSFIYTGGYDLYDGSQEMINGYITSNIQSKLILTGRIPSYIADLISSHPSIISTGFVSRSQLLSLIRNCDICLSPRNPSSQHIKNTFPSKLFKYMQLRKLIACVNYPGLPRSLIDKFILLPDNTEATWALFFREYSNIGRNMLPQTDYTAIPETSVLFLSQFLLKK